MKTPHKGFSLIEVLVTLVVMSLGILGFAALQITSLTSNKVAMDRSHASILAYDIIDAMRANRAIAATEAYDRAIGSAAPTGAATADTDVSNWLTQLAARLPSGNGAIDVVPDPAPAKSGTVQIIIQWDGSKGAAAPSQFTLNTRL